MPPDLIAALPPPAGAVPPSFPALTGISPGAALFASLLAGTVPPPPALVPPALVPPALVPPALVPPALVPPALVPFSAVPSPATAAPLSFTATGPAQSSVSPMPIGTAAAGTEPAPVEAAAPAPRNLVSSNVPPPPLLLLPAALPQTALPPTAPTQEDSPLKDSKKEDTKEPVDTPSAPVPTGELLLPPPPPLVSTVLPPLPAATLPAAAPAATAPAAPRTPEAVRPQPEPATTPPLPAPAAAPVLWTPPVDAPVTPTPAAAVPAAAVPVANAAVATPGFALPTGAGASVITPAPDKNSAAKTPQKDLKTAGARADTYTRTQTELPRLISLTRTELRTDAAPTDGHPTDGTPTEKTRMDERRTDAGQGQAALPAVTPLLSTGTAAAAVPELKVPVADTLTPTEKREIVQQLADGAGGIRLSAPGAAQEMTVQLHPKDWGSLHITVQIAPTDQMPRDAPKDNAPTANAPKKVTAQIVAETPQVKAALESHSGELHQKLREAGLHLDSVTVTVRAPEAASKISGMTPQGGQMETQGRFQEGTQGSLNGGTAGNSAGNTAGNAPGQGGTQGGDFEQRMTDFTGHQDGSPSSSVTSSQSNFQNGSQGGRQGSQTPREPLHWMDTEPDAEAAPHWAATRTSGARRLDLRA